MGNDVGLVATDVAEEYPPRLSSHSWIGECTEHVPLFWLCCFRLTDYKEVRKGDISSRYLCCSYDQSIIQFREGVQIIQKAFPRSFFECAEITRLIHSFSDLMERHRKNFLTLEIWQCDDRPQFEVVLQHCLAGFWHPNCRYFYDPQDVGNWNDHFLPPHESGIMDWAGALRRMFMTCQHQLVELHREIDVSSDDLFLEFHADEYLTGFSDLQKIEPSQECEPGG